MEILWLVGAFVAGALVTWIYLATQHGKRLRDREAALEYKASEAKTALEAESAGHRKTQSALTKAEGKVTAAEESVGALEIKLEKEAEKLKKARNEQRKSKRELTKAEAAEAAASERAETLEADLSGATTKLSKERDDHKTTKQQLSELKSAEAAAGKRASALESDLEKLSSSAEATKAADTEKGNKLKQLQSENKDLGSRLSAAEAAQAKAESERAGLEEKLEQAETAARSAGEGDDARVAELQRNLEENDEELERLEAELAAAREEVTALKASGPSDTTPAAEDAEEEVRAESGEESKAEDQAEDETEDEGEVPETEAAAEMQPHQAEEAGGASSDDLTSINGIGEALQGKLANLGITSFRQIADFTPADIERVNTVLDFPGRIERERWVEQALAILVNSDEG